MHKVWLYAPGENASKWDVCLSQNIMCIGWDEMGNLLEYASKKEMAARLQEIYDKPEASFKNDSLALWEFAHEMQAGDIVIVKKGQNQIIGRGIVEVIMPLMSLFLILRMSVKCNGRMPENGRI